MDRPGGIGTPRGRTPLSGQPRGEYARVAGLLPDEPELCRRDARRRGQEDERPRDRLIVQVRPRAVNFWVLPSLMDHFTILS